MTQGIYAIIGPTGRCYVGQSIKIESRLADHFQQLRSGVHCNIHLTRAFAKHGEELFSTAILEVVEQREFLNVREQFWIDELDAFQSGYNRAAIAGVPPSQVGIAKTQRHRELIAAALRGRPYSAAHRASISQAKKGEPGPKHLEETKQKIADANRRRTLSAETKAKISASKLNMSAETKAKMSKPRSEEAKINIRAAQVARRLREQAARLSLTTHNS